MEKIKNTSETSYRGTSEVEAAYNKTMEVAAQMHKLKKIDATLQHIEELIARIERGELFTPASARRERIKLRKLQSDLKMIDSDLRIVNTQNLKKGLMVRFHRCLTTLTEIIDRIDERKVRLNRTRRDKKNSTF